MALVTDKPEDLAPENDLDHVEDPDAEATGTRAEIYLSGAHVATLDNAPDGLDRITLMVELEVIEEGTRFNENGEIVIPIRRCKRVGDMWRPGDQRPPTKAEIQQMQAEAKAKAAAEQAEQDEAERAEREHNEPPMFDEDGNPISDDAPRPPDDDKADPNTQFDVDEDQDAEPEPSNVVNFSDGAK